jgi:hypothetical protein
VDWPKVSNRESTKSVIPEQWSSGASGKSVIQKPVVKPSKTEEKGITPSRNPLALYRQAHAPTKTFLSLRNPLQVTLIVVGALVIGAAVFFSLYSSSRPGSEAGASSESKVVAERLMPNLKGKSLEEVKDFLISIGIEKWVSLEVASDMEKGLVDSTSPDAGEVLDLDFWKKDENRIRIFYSDGMGDPTQESLTAGGVTMGDLGAIEANGEWGFTDLTARNDILKIPVEVTFTESTTIFFREDCVIWLNETFGSSCGIPRADSATYMANNKFVIPFEASLNSDIKEPKVIRISFKIENSRGISDISLVFRIAYWEWR